MASLKHSNIVKLVEYFETETSIYLVTELLTSDLDSYITARGPLTHSASKSVFKAVAGALHHCHSNGVIHCDVKPANILINLSPKTGEIMDVKLADFGSAQIISPPPKGAIKKGAPPP